MHVLDCHGSVVGQHKKLVGRRTLVILGVVVERRRPRQVRLISGMDQAV